MFTSGNAVDYFMDRLLAISDVRELKGVRHLHHRSIDRFAAGRVMGSASTSRRRSSGPKPWSTPSKRRDRSTADGSCCRAPTSRAICSPTSCAAPARDVDDVAAYRTIPAALDREGGPDIYRMLLDRQIDAVTFTSASTVRNFVAMLGREQAVDLLASTVVAAIGPVTAEAAQQLDIRTTVMPARYTIPDLVDALVEHFTGAGPASRRSRPAEDPAYEAGAMSVPPSGTPRRRQRRTARNSICRGARAVCGARRPCAPSFAKRG